MTSNTSIFNTSAGSSPTPANAASFETNRRADPRFDFEVQPAALRIEFTPGQSTCHNVTPRNLSHNGAGFCIDTFLAPQSPCKFLITGLDQSTVEVSSTIARCDHRRSGVFDTAVRFDHAIDLRRFVRLAASAQPPLPGKPAAIVQLRTSDSSHAKDTLLTPSIRWYIHPEQLAADTMTFVHGRPFDINQPCDVTLFNHRSQRLELSAIVRSSKPISALEYKIELAFDEFPDQTLSTDTEININTDTQVIARGADVNTTRYSATRPTNPLDLDALDTNVWLGHAPAMVIDEFDLDRHLLRALLARLGLRVTDIASVNDPQTQWTPFDVVLMDIGARRADAIESIRSHRAAKFNGIIVAMSADERPDVRAAALEAGANAFLLKPFDHIQVHTLLDRLLSSSEYPQPMNPGEPIISTRKKDRGLDSLLDEFIGNLANHITSLHRALEDADHASLASTCRLLQGAGAGYGFDPVTKQAAQSLEILTDTEPATQEVNRSIRDLIDILTRIRR